MSTGSFSDRALADNSSDFSPPYPFPVTHGNHPDPFGNIRRTPRQGLKPLESLAGYGEILRLSGAMVEALTA
jgi:hypothetical protein